MSPITKNNQKSVEPTRWKREYLRILGGTVTDQDYALVAELEHDGYIRAVLVSSLDEASPNSGKVMFQGLTTKGRLFVDELQDTLYKQSRVYRIRRWLDRIGGWFVGLITPIAVGIILDLWKD